MKRPKHLALARYLSLFGCAVCAISAATDALAEESGLSTRPPGIQGPMGGMLPPPGFYGQESIYLMHGDADAAPLQGRVAADFDLLIVMNILQVTYVAEPQILGGNLGFAATVPFGYVRGNLDLDALGTNASASSDDFDLADFALTPVIGWHAGEFHWTASVTGTIPSGSYNEDRILNVSLNRYAVDPTVGFTWMGSESLIELSAVAGYTVNFENDATNYDSGDSLHVDLAAIKHFNSGLALGVVAYGEFQMTDDSGSGAKLGDFRGHAIGLGPFASYNFALGDVKFNGSARYYHEVETEKRFESDSGFITAAFRF